ncbi:NAD(P)/FAD-dependent oxidoreductase [Paeniglutamicibacter cryotolerans]|uniref:Sarcosine oxidase subunit beta n=1 Tax=Paeniglutamicibacter cryotolerans TaxID=670079 RepID=A0A839QM69_9MICC|nr:FAD-binding oxidoreductase [Paeniglutamicibacter cryotolerans]MBB2997528.1 sarcosine oxidase subunit beta [Paeniglutamicibacter cryotolerans]
MTTVNNAPEVAIIGAGVTGMATAWHLSQRGVRVVVIDRVGVGSGMTAIQPGGVRTQWADNDTFELAKESQSFYENFVERTGAQKDPELVHCGYAFVASKPETLEALRATVKEQNAQGVESRMLTPDELAEMVPGLAVDHILGGSFNGSDGYLNSPGAPVAGFAAGAMREGAEVLLEAVKSLERVADGWVLHFGSGETMNVKKVVVAAGAESAKLLAPLGVELPLVAEPRHLFYSDPISERLIEPLVIFQDEHFAVKHLADGSVLASDLVPLPEGAVADESAIRRDLVAKGNRLIETLAYVRFPVMVTGYYDVTPDQQLLLGPVGDLPGLVLACGLNGRGMMLAPAVGRVVADVVVSGNIEAVPTSMRPDRFADGVIRKREQMVI